jgi:hypothetical protein
MNGIQNKIKSHKVLYKFMDNTITKGNLSKFFLSITFSINFHVGSLGGTTNIETILHLVPRCLKRVWCYRSRSVPYVAFQVLSVVTLTW